MTNFKYQITNKFQILNVKYQMKGWKQKSWFEILVLKFIWSPIKPVPDELRNWGLEFEILSLCSYSAL